jgi:hypothetical protein
VPDAPDPKDPQKKEKWAFYWPLITMSKADINSLAADPAGGLKDAAALAAEPATGPLYTVPAMITLFKDKKEAAEKKLTTSQDAVAAAEKRATATETNKGQVEKDFAIELEKIKAANKKKHDDLDAEFKKFMLKHLQDANNAIKALADKGKEVIDKDDKLNEFEGKIKQLTELLNKLQDQASGGKSSAVSVDSLNLEEKKGEIVRKEGGGFVTINIGSTKKLRPQVTFLVVSADVSWLALQEKEKALEKASGRIDRNPYEDNPYVKAGIEVVEVTGPDSARAKVIFENEPIRNPIAVRDQIFNLAWQPADEIRIAFAGIIDLDGDGLDNNEEFLRLLERQGVIVDEYLRLKPLEFVKRDAKGMSLRTKYLVIAPHPRLDSVPIGKDSPQKKQIEDTIKMMSDIELRARSQGVQMIEARKFLTMIGYKLPRSPSPPQYGASVYLDLGGAPPAPEGGKKEGN